MILSPIPAVVQTSHAQERPITSAGVQGELPPLVAVAPADAPDEPAPQPDKRIVIAPAWVRPPTLAEVSAIYPAAAAADEVSGQAQIVCRIEPDTTLGNCYGDEPTNAYGFNAALLSLSSRLRIRQKTVDGMPVENGRVLITLRFIYSGPGRTFGVLWTSAPTSADVRAAMPRPDGRPAKSGGRGVMRCKISGGLLTDCQPSGDRTDVFSRAAIKLASKFTAGMAFANGRATEGVIINIPVIFDAPGEKPPAAVLENPVRFIHAPTNAQRNAVFPQAAKDHGVTTLSATEACVVAPDGSLTRCRTTKEAPNGLGGAEAASRLVNAFQLPTWTAEGRSTAGAPVTVDIVWAPPATRVAPPSASGRTGPQPTPSAHNR